MSRRSVALVLATFAALAAAPASAAELRAHGLLDLCATVGHGEGRLANLTSFNDSSVDPYRLRLFIDASIAPGLEAYAQTILHEGTSGVRADGAYVLWTPRAGRDLHLEAGKIPWPVGTWAPRTYSDKNPLVGAPLMYQHHASLPWNKIPVDVDDLVARAGNGQEAVSGAYDWIGMPVVDDRWWDAGVVALGVVRPMEFAAGVVRGSPGWPEPGAESDPGRTVLGRLGLAPVAGVRVGVSGARGTWVPGFSSYALPPGRSPADYHERLGMADLELMRDRYELRAEGFVKALETVTTGTLRIHGGYVEAKVGVGAGAWLASRVEAMRFGDVTASAGVRPWDDDMDRYEAGIGYRATREVQLRLTAQRTARHASGAAMENTDLGILLASIRF